MDPKLTLKLQNVTKCRTQKNNKKLTASMEAKMLKLYQNGAPKKVRLGGFSGPETDQNSKDVLGSKRHPKGVQKASKRRSN